MWKIVICCAMLSTVRATNEQKQDLVKLSVIHINDIHARFEETSRTSTRCVEDCIGGFSRMYTAINDLFFNEPNSILLNAGDSFQGTLWYNLHKWNVTQYFLNKLPTDAYTLGNHEFDDGIDGVVPFIKALNCPVVVANMDVSREPRMQGIFNKSTIVFRNNMKIGIVGVIVSNTNVISRTEKVKFTDEVAAVNQEAERLMKQENCSTIIVLSHCGIDIDKMIARHAVPGISLVVGGHTHTFLYSGSKLPGPESPKGPYPTVVRNKYGKNVLIVQASFNTKYVGNISVWYNKFGEVVSWDGTPIYMDSKIRQDELINREVAEWKKSVDDHGNTILGISNVLLDRNTRRSGESNIGSFLTDAMVDHYVSRAENGSWTYASIAIINSGAIRTSILPGNITVSDLVASQPFGNTIDCVELTGQNIKELLEYSVTPSIVRPYQFHEFLQVSGIRVTFDISQPIGYRVVRLKLRCHYCEVPNYFDVDYTKSYRVLIPSFLAIGGDGYSIIQNNMRNRIIGEDDVIIYSKYITKVSPITQGHDERIVMQGSFNNVHSGHVSNHSSSLTYSLLSLVVVYTVTAMYYVQLYFVL